MFVAATSSITGTKNILQYLSKLTLEKRFDIEDKSTCVLILSRTSCLIKISVATPLPVVRSYR